MDDHVIVSTRTGGGISGGFGFDSRVLCVAGIALQRRGCTTVGGVTLKDLVRAEVLTLGTVSLLRTARQSTRCGVGKERKYKARQKVQKGGTAP